MSAARKNATPLAAFRRPRRSYKFAASLRSTSQALRTGGGGVTDRQNRRGNLAPLRFFRTQSGCLQRLAARDDFPPRTWSLPLNTGRRGSWQRSLGPSLRRRQSANASESAEEHAAADSPPPIESALSPTDCWNAWEQPQAACAA